MTAPTRITHLLAGRPWEGTAERTSPVFNPATGEQTGILDLASAGARRRGRRRREEGLGRELGQRLTHQAHPGAVRASASCSTSARRRSRRSSPPSTARSSPTPSARSPAASRSPSSPAASRTCSRVATPRTPRPSVDVYSIRQSLGVVAVISPFNFPAMVPLWFIPVAIAAGNAVVLKPSREGPVGGHRHREAVDRGGAPRRRHERRQR